MRIREIEFYNFRAFRGHRRISFVDPLTDTVRPVTVLAGSNGSGKTTVLEAISAMLASVVHPEEKPELLREVGSTGAIHLVVELAPEEISPASRWANRQTTHESQILEIAVGREHPQPVQPDVAGLRRALQLKVTAMEKEQDPMHGGVLFFPHDRRLDVVRGASIDEPPPTLEWLFRFAAKDKWQGSLEQLWTWQNYLDLEQNAQDRDKLDPFVASVEALLGPERPITIREGRVRVPVKWKEDNGRPATVRLDQLPSGEQQVLLLFGELVRRRRPGAVITIDEVENSLHPTLQRLVMWNLRRLAREWDAQVIVATHSLEVINTVRGAAFVNLDYPEDRFDLPGPIDGEEVA